MRRLVRHALRLLSASSLLLCAALCALWVRSYYTQDILRANMVYRSWLIYSNAGRASFIVTGASSDLDVRVAWDTVEADPDDVIAHIDEFAGIRWTIGPPTVPIRAIDMPVGYLALASAWPVAAFAMCRIVAKRRKVVGMCPFCGYDLRATPDRCPECGRGAGRSQ